MTHCMGINLFRGTEGCQLQASLQLDQHLADFPDEQTPRHIPRQIRMLPWQPINLTWQRFFILQPTSSVCFDNPLLQSASSQIATTAAPKPADVQPTPLAANWTRVSQQHPHNGYTWRPLTNALYWPQHLDPQLTLFVLQLMSQCITWPHFSCMQCSFSMSALHSVLSMVFQEHSSDLMSFSIIFISGS